MLVDTSVWIDHFRRGNASLTSSLEKGEVESHPYVVGELACGNLRRREEVLSLLAALRQVPEVTHEEAMTLVRSAQLMGKGLGWVDVHLLAAAIVAGTKLWTLDERLRRQAMRLGVASG